MVISYSLRGFEAFLNVHASIYMRFGENNVLGTIYIYIYQFQGGSWGRLYGSPYILGLLLIKMEKVQEHDLY